LTREVGQTDLLFGAQSGLISSLCVQDYKSLCAAATICATLINIETHRHRQTVGHTAYINSTARCAKKTRMLRAALEQRRHGCQHKQWPGDLMECTELVRMAEDHNASREGLFTKSHTPVKSIAYL